MPWVWNPGGTLLAPSGETHHLFVILNARADFDTREPVSEAFRLDLIAGLYASPLTPRYLKKLKLV
jgi:hypothetical protein